MASEIDEEGIALEAIQVASPNVVEALSRAEIDRQIATAKQYPRPSAKKIAQAITEMATINQETADDCGYALPRSGKTIHGPSARFAEIVAYCYGNCRAGARIVDEGPEFVTAQGLFFDIERNVALSFEVRRRITNKSGKRFDADMVGVTGNAAASIALRFAVLRGVPKPIWQESYEASRKMVAGTMKNLPTRRSDAIKHFQKFGASEVMVLETLGVEKVEEVTEEHLVMLKGLAVAIRDGETTVDSAFVPEWQAVENRKNRAVRTGLAVEGEEEKGTWWSTLRGEIERVWSGGKRMKDSEVWEKLHIVRKAVDGPNAVQVVDERNFSIREMRGYIEHLKSYPKRADGGNAGARPAGGTEAAAPAPSPTEEADDPKGFDEQHADANATPEEEAPPSEEEAPKPQAEDRDGRVETLLALVKQAKKSKPGAVFVKESPEGSGTLWFSYKPINDELGFIETPKIVGASTTKYPLADEQTIRKLVISVRALGVSTEERR